MNAILLAALLSQQNDYSSVSFVSSVNKFQPGRPFIVSVRLAVEEGWHSYWENPGKAGQATKLDWKLPRGWKAEFLGWPVPMEFDTAGEISFGYEGNVDFLYRITPPMSVPHSKVKFGLDASWMICKDQCFFSRDSLEGVFTKGSRASVNAKNNAGIERALKALPTPISPRVVFVSRREDNLTVTVKLPEVLAAPKFFPGSDIFGATSSSPTVDTNEEKLIFHYKLQPGATLKRFNGIITGTVRARPYAYSIDSPISVR